MKYLPSVSFVSKLVVGLVVIGLVAKMLPENVKQWVRI